MRAGMHVSAPTRRRAAGGRGRSTGLPSPPLIQPGRQCVFLVQIDQERGRLDVETHRIPRPRRGGHRGRTPGSGRGGYAHAPHRGGPRQPARLDGGRRGDRPALPRLGDGRDPRPLRRRRPLGRGLTVASVSSPVTSPAPGWARRLPVDEKVFLWAVVGSVAFMSVFAIAWLFLGGQNVPVDSYRTT